MPDTSNTVGFISPMAEICIGIWKLDGIMDIFNSALRSIIQLNQLCSVIRFIQHESKVEQLGWSVN